MEAAKMHEATKTVAPHVILKSETDGAIRKRAKELAGEVDTAYMEMARLLYAVYDRPGKDGKALYQSWGYPTFADYAEQELGINQRKAEYLRRIWYRLEVELTTLDPTLKQNIVALGWTKVRALERVLTLSNAAEWLERAKSASVPTIEHQIKLYLSEREKALKQAEDSGKDPHNVPETPLPKDERFTPRTFYLADDQLELVEAALKRAAILAESDKRGHLLTLICMDFLATNYLGKADKDIQIKYLTKFEKILGLKMIVVEDDDILYGIDTLNDLAKKVEG